MATITLKKSQSASTITPAANTVVIKVFQRDANGKLVMPRIIEHPQGRYAEKSPSLPRRYDSVKNTKRPQSRQDVVNYALDLIDASKFVFTERRFWNEEIWIKPGSCYLGKRKPTLRHFKQAIQDLKWKYGPDGYVRESQDKTKTTGYAPPDIHLFTKEPPTGMDVFETHSGEQLGGYTKFFFYVSAPDDQMEIISFHELHKSTYGRGR